MPEMELTVTCETCSMVVARCDTVHIDLLAAMIIACHATHPHCSNHKLMPAIAPYTAAAALYTVDQHDFIVECLPCHMSQTHRCPLALVAAYTIAFHAQHEGHALQLTLDGVIVHPPCPTA